MIMANPYPEYVSPISLLIDGEDEIHYEIPVRPIYCSDVLTREIICIESILAPSLLEKIASGKNLNPNEILEFDETRNVIVCKYLSHDTLLV